MPAPSCPRCGIGLQEGYLLDHNQHLQTVTEWIEGAPEKSFWTGLRVKGRQRLPVTAWRCGRCGYVELNAASRS